MHNIYKHTNSIPSSENLPIRYDLYIPDNQKESLSVVLFLHGFKGFKDWGPFPDACEDLARRGFAVLAMNFSRNGVGENPVEFDRLDLFERETLSQDLDDVGRIISAVKKGEVGSNKGKLNSDFIGVVGHSRGGHTAVAAASEYTEIQCLVTWSAVADYNARWSDEMVKDWEIKGYTDIQNARTGQTMKVDRVVYDDAIENADRLMAIKRVKDLHLPALFIAGREDEAVPWTDSEKLYKTCPSDHKELRVIPGTGHTFDASHPFHSDDYPEKFSELLHYTGEWLQEYLK